jgi:anti-sigma B factor antagonist
MSECTAAVWVAGSTPLSVHREGGALRLGGEVDLATCPAFENALARAIAQDAGDIVIDCSAITFFGAVGVDALVRAYNQLDGSGRRIIIRNPSSVVRRLLDIAQVTELFAEVANRANSSPTD